MIFHNKSEEKSGGIFLRALSDGKWIAYFCPKKHGVKSDYIFLTEEGRYPVTLYYERYDVMGSKVVEAHVSHTQQDLLDMLGWCGQCRCRILELWQHRLNNASDQKLFELYDACDKRRYEIAQEDIHAFMEEDKK